MEDDYFDIMKTNKNSINNVINNVKLSNDQFILDILQDAIYRTNKIVYHTYNFLKLYVLHLHNTEFFVPFVDEHLIRTIMNVVSIRNDNRGPKPNTETNEIIKKLTLFYKKYYIKTIDNDIVSNDKLSQILNYEATDIIKNINTNIKEHYTQHVNKLINVTFDWKRKIAKINNNTKIDLETKKKLKSELYYEFKKIKNDVFNIKNDELTSNVKYHKWIKLTKCHIIPHKDNYSKNSIHYDVCCNPQDYIESLIFINQELESFGTDDDPIKLFHVLPLRTRIIPNYITLDTWSIINLFFETDKLYYLSNIKIKQKEIWNKFFKTNDKSFKKGEEYRFNYMIKTDGVGCSILFIKLDSNKEPIKVTKNKLKKMEVLKKNDTKYIEDQPKIAELIGNKNYVCIDPNLSDLMYCQDKNGTKFRYTQNQRRLETRNKKYNKVIQKINTETRID